jgi:hypothetical protein
MDHKKLFNKYPSSSSHAKNLCLFAVGSSQSHSHLCQEGKGQSRFSTFILGSYDFEKNSASFAQFAALVRQCGQL